MLPAWNENTFVMDLLILISCKLFFIELEKERGPLFVTTASLCTNNQQLSRAVVHKVPDFK